MSLNLTEGNIIDHFIQSRSLIVTDIHEAPACQVFCTLCKLLSPKYEKIFIVAIEMDPDFYQLSLQNKDLTILNIYSDFELWKLGRTHIKEKIIEFVTSISDKKTLLIIDSLDTFFVDVIFYQTLNIYLSDKRYVIAYSHRDVTDITYCLFSIHLEIFPIKSHQYKCIFTRKKPSGKFESTKEVFNIINDRITDVEKFNIFVSQNDQVKEDGFKDVTFRLNLNENEELARKNLQLPYIKAQNKSPQQIGTQSSTGTIFYEPDEADDFDDEDPDDDLDV